MNMTDRAFREAKLNTLMKGEGFDDRLEFLGNLVCDSVCPGICMTPGCDYSTEVEPDQRQGHCEECERGTVESALSIAGLI